MKFNKPKQYVQIAILAFLGGIGSWAIAHYETLIPYRWHLYTSTNPEFSIRFPGAPTSETRRVKGAVGEVTVHLVQVQTPDGVYAVGYGDGQLLPNQTIENRLNSSRDGSISNVQGTLVMEKKITVQGYAGREIKAQARKGMFLDARLIAVSDRNYVIGVVSNSEASRDDRNIHKFFDSFKPSLP
jgi:hypothetical protein